jgi:ring-1,2-phenylacetyl-CoA epoxidase subunit PaaD
MVMGPVQRVEALLQEVMDPELPFLNVVEMGMIKGVKEMSSGHIRVLLSPTYSGCPATDFIKEDVERVLRQVDPAGVVEVVLTPAWSTDDLAPSARQKMAENGIAPPESRKGDKGFLTGDVHRVPCPRCKSENTEMVSAFGSTACKAHFKCLDCLEPFDHFKCL